MTSIEKLKSLVPPPEQPTCAGTLEGFGAFEQELGTQLPADFKHLVLSYGSGVWFDDFLWVINPFDPLIVKEWQGAPDSMMAFYREMRDKYGPMFNPYPVWPEKGGLLSWGGNTNGGEIYWLTEGDPDQWPTIYRADRTPEYERIEQTCIEFLISAILGESKQRDVHDWAINSRIKYEPTKPPV